MAKKRTKIGSGTLPAQRGTEVTSPAKLLADLRELIDAARAGVAQSVNAALVLLYWQVGSRIQAEVLHNR
jgi:hypothetical protein